MDRPPTLTEKDGERYLEEVNGKETIPQSYEINLKGFTEMSLPRHNPIQAFGQMSINTDARSEFARRVRETGQRDGPDTRQKRGNVIACRSELHEKQQTRFMTGRLPI